MDYSKFQFKNKPLIEEMLKENVFIYGPVGAGKSVLLHQMVEEISHLKSIEDYIIYIHDPKMVEFTNEKDYSFVKRIVTTKDMLGFIREINDRISSSKTHNKKIVLISDEICDSGMEETIMSFYSESVKYDVILILASQLKDVFYRNKNALKNGKVLFIKGNYKDSFRTIEIVDPIGD